MDPANPRHLVHPRKFKVGQTFSETYGKKPAFADYLGLIRELDAISTLRHISIVSRKMEIEDLRITPDRKVSRESLAFLARATLLEAKPEGGRSPLPRELDDLNIMYTDFTDDALGSIRTPLDPARMASFFIQNMQANELHKPYRTAVPRAVALYRDLPARMTLAFDFPRAFREITGLEPMDYIACAHGLFSLFLQPEAPHIDVVQSVRDMEPAVRAKLVRCADYISLDIQGFRERFPGGIEDIFGLNPLSIFPLVKTGASFLCPIKSLLLEKMTNGIYHDLFTRHKEVFAKSFGYVFQEYVGKVLKPHIGGQVLVPEQPYGTPENRTPDWTLLAGKHAVLIECKTKRLRFGPTKAKGDLNALREDLEKGVVDAVLQANRFLRDLRSEKDLRSFSSVKRAHVLVVTLDDYYLANDPFLRREIEALLRSKTSDPLPAFSVVDVEEFEVMVVLGKENRRGLYGVIDHWRIDQDYGHDSFHNYATLRLKRNMSINKDLERSFDAIYGEIVKILFGADAPMKGAVPKGGLVL